MTPTIPIEMDEREHREASKAREEKHWRRVLLDALGVAETPRKVGRPPRVSLDSLQVGSGVSLEDGETRAREVDSLADVFEEAQRERERLKAGG